MNSTKQINAFFRASSLIIVLLSLWCKIYGHNNSSIAFKNVGFSSETHSSEALSYDHASFDSSLDGSKSTLYFELEEDNDDDNKAHSLAFLCCTQVRSFNEHLVSGHFYIKAFLFYEKTPRFILYKNFKHFLS